MPPKCFNEDIYGYTTYYDTDGAFCQLVVLESGIQRKTGSGFWTKIYDFVESDETTPTAVSHPVKSLEIQGKIFVIHENDSRMIHYDKEDYQIGIDAPRTIPTSSTDFPDEDTLPLNELFAYADTSALDAVWTYGDVDLGESTIESTGPAVQGPDGHDLYLKLSASGISGTTIAKRSLTVPTSLASKFTVEINTYFDSIGGNDGGALFLNLYSGAFRVPIRFAKGNVSITDLSGHRKSFGSKVKTGKWINWKFEIDGTDSSQVSVKAYKNNKYLKKKEYSYLDTTNEDLVEIIQNNKVGSDIRACYIDSIKITTDSDTAAASTSDTGIPGEGQGSYRYAVTYFRTGNYGCESNPLKCIVGSPTFVGTGLDDLTVAGTYTGDVTKTFRVQIDGAGTPDTVKWSEDDGETWNSKLINITIPLYLSYGLTLAFGATTGHTATEYWYFTCTLLAATPVGQIVNLTSIPVSTDPQVTGRKLYRSTRGGSRFYWLATIYDNTTTTYTDNISDTTIQLGLEMEEDHDLAPAGKFSAWWDERLWISGDDIVYYSAILYPEHFDIGSRYVTVQRGDMSDEITQIVPYKDSLYVFRKRAIYAIQKTSEGYGIFLITADVGCVAPFSMVEVNNMLMFLSHRGFELFNGTDVYGLEPSLPIDRSVKTIDMTKTDYICGMHYPEKREVWWSVPDRVSPATAITMVYHYLADAWYFFTFYRVPSCIVSYYNSSKGLAVKMGTRDGYLCLCESTYLDNATAITATYRKPWYETGEVADIRRLDVEYEIPSGMSLTTNIYVNFDKDVQRTDTMVGNTISSNDIELRRPHMDFSELGQRAKYTSIEFTNAENLGGDLKINEITLYVRDRAIKGKIYGD